MLRAALWSRPSLEQFSRCGTPEIARVSRGRSRARRYALRVGRGSTCLLLIRADELTVRDHVAFDRREEFRPGHRLGKLRVECVDVKAITMAARGWTRSGVACLAH